MSTPKIERSQDHITARSKSSLRLPMLRGGNPDEVANAIIWLLSEQASYVTGTFIEAAGEQ